MSEQEKESRSNLGERVFAAQSKYSKRWEEVCAKLAHLKRLDTFCVRYEAHQHGYEFGPCLSLAEIRAIEDELGLPLPPELLFLYNKVGSGGPGPPDGLYRAQQLRLWSIQDYRKEQAERWGEEQAEDAAEYLAHQFAELHIDSSTVKLVCFLDRFYEPYAFCVDWMYVVCGGPKDGAVVVRTEGDEHLVSEIGDSVADILDKWLDREIAIFHRAQKKVEASESLEEIWDALSRCDLAALGQSWHYLEFGERGDKTLELPAFVRIIESLLGAKLADTEEVEQKGRLLPEYQVRFQEARRQYLERSDDKKRVTNG